MRRSRRRFRQQPAVSPHPRGSAGAGARIHRGAQGLAEEVYPHGITVAALSPSQVVVTPGVLAHASAYDRDEEQLEAPWMMGAACALLVAGPLDEMTGRVCHSQQLLHEYGRLPNPRGAGVDAPGSAFARA